MLSLACLLPALLVSGCGGGDGSTTSRVKQLLGKVYAKVIGDKIGLIKANINEIAEGVSEIQGTLEVDGRAYPFKSNVSRDGIFQAQFPMLTNGTGSQVARGDIYGTVVENPSSAAEPLSIRGNYLVQLPRNNGSSGYTNLFDGEVVPSSSNASSATTGIVSSPSSGTSSRATGTITVSGKSCEITTKKLSTDAIGSVCGKQIYFAGFSTTNYRTFNCEGNGIYKDDSLAPGNQGHFIWGYALSATDKTKLDIRPVKDFGISALVNYGLDKSTRPFVQICYAYTDGNAAPKTYTGVLGEFNGVQQFIGDNGGFWQSK